MSNLQFARLAVRIERHQYLNFYFKREDLMIQAASYHGVYDIWQRNGTNDLFSIQRFLSNLFLWDVKHSTFTRFLSWIINDYPRFKHQFNNYLKQEMLESLSDFFYELNVLGFEWDDDELIQTIGSPSLDLEITSRIEGFLAQMGNPYLNRYHGALQTLTSDSPDSLSQSLMSLRELIRDVLKEKTKHIEFSESELIEGKPKRRAQLKYILNSEGLSKEGEVGDAIASLGVIVNNALSKGTHLTKENNWADVLFVFKSSEYLL